jgi:hypothetical protein
MNYNYWMILKIKSSHINGFRISWNYLGMEIKSNHEESEKLPSRLAENV